MTGPVKFLAIADSNKALQATVNVVIPVMTTETIVVAPKGYPVQLDPSLRRF
jgi:hypothetical protein